MAVAALASGSYVWRGGRAACGAFAVACLLSSPRGTERLAALFRVRRLPPVRAYRAGERQLRRLDCSGAEIAPFDNNVVSKARRCLSFRRRPPFQQPPTSTEERIGPTFPRKIGPRRIGGGPDVPAQQEELPTAVSLRVSARDSVGDLPVSVATWRMAFSSAKPSLATSAVEILLARSATTLGRSPDTLTSAEIGDAAAADTGVDLAVAGVGAGEVGDAGASSIAAIARNSLRRSPRRTPIFSRS